MKLWAFGFLAFLLCPAAAQADLSSVACYLGTQGTAGTPVSEKALKRGIIYDCFAYGSWLDITNSVTASSGLTVAIKQKGGGPSNPYVSVRVQVGTQCSFGDKKITLKRPSLTGTDSDSFGVTVVQ